MTPAPRKREGRAHSRLAPAPARLQHGHWRNRDSRRTTTQVGGCKTAKAVHPQKWGEGWGRYTEKRITNVAKCGPEGWGSGGERSREKRFKGLGAAQYGARTGEPHLIRYLHMHFHLYLDFVVFVVCMCQVVSSSALLNTKQPVIACLLLYVMLQPTTLKAKKSEIQKSKVPKLPPSRNFRVIIPKLEF